MTSVTTKVVTTQSGTEYNSSTNKVVDAKALYLYNGNYATSTTGTTAYVVGLATAITQYTAGLVVGFVPDATGGHATLNANSIGAKSIKRYVGGVKAPVISGDIAASTVANVIYDGTDFVMVSGPSRGGDRVLYRATAAYTTNGTNSYADIFSVNVPGGSLGLTSSIRVRITGTASTLSDVATVYFKINYGASSLEISSPINQTTSSLAFFSYDAILTNSGATNSQYFGATLGGVGNKGSVTDHLVAAGAGTGNQDSTADKTLNVQFKWNVTTGSFGSNSMNLPVVVVELIS